MSMFQNSVLKSVKQNESLIASRWAEYQKFLSKIDWIEDAKEETYQDGFLRDIFENCLGYTLDSTDPRSFNLSREKKNEQDSKKADGAIYADGHVVGVIELKGQDTKNLSSVETQAFGYLVSHSHAKYVITSNFDELRFYIDKKTAYAEFSLFRLTYEEFTKLHLLLSHESIREDIPLKLKEKSVSFEQEISKKLYKDFSLFRMHLYENMVKNNDLDKALLLRLTQKLCDRIVFILFAEDRGLLSPNTIKKIRRSHQADGFGDRSMYDYFKLYFDAINAGNEKLGIPKYNGGLFLKDTLLDSLVIDDAMLDMKAQALSDYDFMSDISVNILGHIFEQSLTDLEEINALINNDEFDSKKTKRKKDGVFYTPEYITEYIIDNTLGKLCRDKKEELGLVNIAAPRNPKKPTKKEQATKDNLELYRVWLLDLKILDPACGSGAFLNQALEFLLKEHTALQEYQVVMGDLMAYHDIEKSILENNLYGVDINEDAVEIARLSLWLRTAHKGRELTKLADKILVANSLLEMPFDEGSFDIVVGNPPYVRMQGLKGNYENESKLYEEKYKSATGNYDMYVLFLEMSFHMLKPTGKLSYILPHKFLVSGFGSGIRGFLSENKAVESLLHFGSEMVFEDARAYTCIITLSHENRGLKFKSLKPDEIFEHFEYNEIPYEELDSDKWNLSNPEVSKVLEKLEKQPLKAKDIFESVSRGIVTGADDIFLLTKTDGGLYSKSLNKIVEIEDQLLKPLLKGNDIHRYGQLDNKYYVLFPYIATKDKTVPITENLLSEKFPKAYSYFIANQNHLKKRERGKFNKPSIWYLFSRQQGLRFAENEKIITPYLSFFSQMSIDPNGNFYTNDKCSLLFLKNDISLSYKFFLAILNSSLMWFFIKNTSAEFSGGYYVYSSNYIKPFPLPALENKEDQNPFIEKTNLMLQLNKKLQEAKQNFINELKLGKVSKKLQNFEELEFDEFIKEYKKAKKLKFTDKLEERNFKNEWRSLFENDTRIALDLKTQIGQTDKEIDKMVYVLYGLTSDEIRTIEEV